ncbi:MAG: hypothetical protein JWN14_3002 [Chthonomonadales bacterium]|nr:hypothetical protein [Chthonomonadales bacterium]
MQFRTKISSFRSTGSLLMLSLMAGALLATLPLHSLAADTPAIGFAPGATGFEDNAANALGDPLGSFSLGFEFTANSPVFVTALGYFNDPFFDPLTPTFAGPHQVGLYQVTPGAGGNPPVTTLLAQASVTSGGTPNGFFLYQSLASPVQLMVGGDYVLAGVTGPTDPYFFDVQDINGNAALTVDPAINYIQDRYIASSTLAYPDSTDPLSEPGFFGPNFLTGSASPSDVPEPSAMVSFCLFVLSGSALAWKSRRRGRRTA